MNTNRLLGDKGKGLMTQAKKIHHVAFVVDSIEDSLSIWNVLGLKVEAIKDVPEQESRVAFLPLGDSKIELVEPITASSGIARYLEKRGPGMHHICIEVEDILGLLVILNEKGFRLINATPQVGTDGRKCVFIHPESTKGVLVELYELPVKKQ
ncbi:MAG TPA: methylmalonyl-CoA epimerase [Anaerolineales bacterium]|nr:methylmalonyl-CoA epimerase [Anaerolineales bacterium]